MNINNIRGSYAYSGSSLINKVDGKDGNSIKSSPEQSSKYRDTVHISNSTRNVSASGGIGINIDKGTAANTTMYVDRSSYNQILNYTTNNPDCQWSETGIDGEKRWVVVNGQRFECPLTEEEKAIRKKLAESCNLVSILSKADKEKENDKSKSKKHNSVKISFDGKKGIKVDGIEGSKSSEKVKNLIKNEKVMNMLSDIMAKNGGIGITLGLG